MSVFGAIVTGYEVEQGVISHLQNWMPTYLAEMERVTEREPETLPQPRSWTTVPRQADKWPEDQLPAVLVVSTGLTDEPKNDGDGNTRAIWSIGLAVICSANTEELTHEFAKLYFAALRAAMCQHPAIGGIAEGTTWKSEDYDQYVLDSRRTMASGFGIFHVEVTNVLDVRAGLLVPPADPYDVAEFTDIEETEVEVTKL